MKFASPVMAACLTVILSSVALPQGPKPAEAAGKKSAREMSEAEQKDLRNSLSEAGSSPIEFMRALERHLAKYPMTPQREELENALVKAAIEAKDNRATLLYGERVLARNMDQPV